MNVNLWSPPFLPPWDQPWTSWMINCYCWIWKSEDSDLAKKASPAGVGLSGLMAWAPRPGNGGCRTRQRPGWGLRHMGASSMKQGSRTWTWKRWAPRQRVKEQAHRQAQGQGVGEKVAAKITIAGIFPRVSHLSPQGLHTSAPGVSASLAGQYEAQRGPVLGMGRGCWL